MTFSIVALDPDTGDLGVAVQSKFPGVGVNIPFARAGVGAIATQAFCNTRHGHDGLTLMAHGADAAQTLEILVAQDPHRELRQIGLVDAGGRGASHTGERCFDYCGSVTGEGFSVQGNTLAGAAVLDSMAAAFESSRGPLVERLIQALQAGQAAGGDRRGQQSAAVRVVREGGGYGGGDDRYIEISIYDHPAPIDELSRCYALHRLSYLHSDPARLVPVDAELGKELQTLLNQRGFYDGRIDGVHGPLSQRALQDFMGWENYDERIRDDALIDLEVLDDMRVKHRQWLASGKRG